ncbi:arylesterase [Pseudomonas sp. F1_0610]|uniref:arylesterase n=1 Tax=Pseudomonas sp. F1_0610 TaxID=3114284 RepID=UPI0039C030E7
MRKWFITAFLGLFYITTTLAQTQTVLVMGDSISAGFGVEIGKGWVTLFEQRLLDKGHDFKVINASISGETSAQGLARLESLLIKHQPNYVIIELGGNDGLRALALPKLEANLEQMIQQSKGSGAKVLLLGMQIPPNYGPGYTDGFKAIYAKLADKHQIALVPFFLEGIAGQTDLMQNDGIHPTTAAQPQLLDNMWASFLTLLNE